jgi:aldehyde:ferredoxin oxidoreductase
MTKGKPAGYNGKILRVNLSSGTITTETIDEAFCHQYIGGAGFIFYYLWKELKPGIDPLGPDNKLIFALGPLSGLPLPGSARNCIGAKSPLTGGVAKSEVGGFWAAELKRAGYDAIIIEGKAEKPVYLWVHDGEASLKDASHLWGKETKETETAIRNELGDTGVHIALIGPGGENLVRYACIMEGLHDAAGRGGLGAVMGSKQLKAIAVRGHTLPPVADREHVKQIRQQIAAIPLPVSEFGTGGPDMMFLEAMSNLPVRNFRDGLFPDVEKIHGGVMKETMSRGMEGCFGCRVRCKKVLQFDTPYPVDAVYGGPEYESTAALGSNCGVNDVKAIVKANERCGAYSLDTISTGVTIAFAMECFEKGLLNSADTGGIELKFGNSEAMLKVIDLIAKREGIGNLLAEGTARLSRKIGKGSEKFAMNVKGLEVALHEPRLSASLGLGYMVNPHGADHCASLIDALFLAEPVIMGLHHLGIYDPPPPNDISPRKIAYSRLVQLKSIVEDCLTICAFLPYSVDKEAELLSAVTGWNTGAIDLMRVAERVLTIARLFNIREGFSARDDVLPERFFQPKSDGPLSDQCLDHAEMEKAKSYYYSLMGWDTEGVPLPEKVAELDIK